MVKTLVLGPLCANCHIVTDENGVGFVVDPGANAWKIFPELEGLDIKYVIFTHEHYDHIMAASEVMEKTGAKLVASRFTAENIHDRDKTLLCWFPGVKNELPDVDIAVKDGMTLTAGKLTLEFFETPGHSPGGITVKCGNDLFTGDTLFYHCIGRTDFVGGDMETLVRSVKEKIFTLNGDVTVYPGHDRTTTVSEEKNHNPFFTE